MNIGHEVQSLVEKSVAAGIFPRFIFVNLVTMKELEKELKGGFKIKLGMPDNEPIHVFTANVRIDDRHSAIIRIDNKLADGEIVLK